MIDFMVNIKNKKNMTIGNMKTFMTTSVLCVFFNGILIYGMKNNNTQNQKIDDDNILNSSNNNIKNDDIKNSINNENYQIDDKNETNEIIKEQKKNKKKKEQNKIVDIDNIIQFNSQQNDTSFLETNKTIKILSKGDLILSDKEKDSSIFYNYKGHYSLFCCCNLWNNKEENQKKYIYEQRILEEKRQRMLEEEEKNKEKKENLNINSASITIENLNDKNKVPDINSSTEMLQNNNNNKTQQVLKKEEEKNLNEKEKK